MAFCQVYNIGWNIERWKFIASIADIDNDVYCWDAILCSRDNWFYWISFYAVMTDSMEPRIPTYSMVLTKTIDENESIAPEK